MDFQPTTVNIDLIKQEGNITVCNACLSANRTLFTLNDKADLFMYLLGHQAIILDPKSIFICWECKAILKKMRNFQYQVQYAQTVLHQMFYDKELLPKPLSKLSYCNFENLHFKEMIFENDETNKVIDKYTEIIGDLDASEIVPISDIESNRDFTDTKETIVQEVKEEYLEAYEDTFIDHPGFSDQSEPDTKIETKETVKREKKKFLFNKLALRTRIPEVDLGHYESCFSESMLTDYEIENLGRFLKENKKVKVRSLYCEKCRKEFDSAIDIKRHKTFCHILKTESPGPFKCLDCTAVCQDKSSLRAHWTKHNTIKRCKLCNSAMFWKSTLKQHAELHAYFWTCTVCKDLKAVYRSFKEFGHHYRSLHRRAICDYCGNKSKSKKALANHIRLKHLPPVCTICDKQFKDNHCLRRHTSQTHPEIIDKKVDPELTYCVECDKQFPSVAKYKLHVTTTLAHNPDVANRKTIVPCPDCGKQFTRKSYMNNHYRLFHQKQTKHYCKLCDKYLVSAWSMKIHIKGVHQKIREPKTKICDICGRAFGTNAVLVKHRRTHTGERPYKCAHCPAAFAQSSALNSHTRTQHKS